MPKQAFAESMARWGLLKQGLDANAADLTFLAAEHDRITTLAANLAALNAQQEALKAQTQQVTQALHGGMDQMIELESRVRNSLKGKYGTKNEKLEEFGIKPRRPRTARKPAG
jgi:hypothetical protein